MNTPLTLGKIITLVLSLKDPFYRKYLNRLNHPERSHTLENNKTNGRDLLFPVSVFHCPYFLNWGMEPKDLSNHQRREKSLRAGQPPLRKHLGTALRTLERTLLHTEMPTGYTQSTPTADFPLLNIWHPKPNCKISNS